MRILIVRNAYSYDFGGAERLAVGLGSELTESGYEALVVSRQQRLLSFAAERGVPSIRGWWWAQQNWSGLKFALLPLYAGWLFVLVVWYIGLILKEKPGALHLMSRDDFIAGTIASKLFGIRVVWTDCADLKFIYRNHDVWYKNPVGKFVYATSHLAHKIILVSNNEKRLVAAALGRPCPSNYTVIYSTVGDHVTSPIDRNTLADVVIFCSTSRLVTAKGIQDLIAAFMELSKDNHNCLLWLVGDGPDETIFRQQAANMPNIRFWGHSNTPLEYLAAADVYVHPSHHEGFSLALAEAAMLGKPLIATRIGGNPEIVNDSNGILVETHNVAELTEAMRSLLNSKSLRISLGQKARKDFTQHFDFKKVVKEHYLPLYEK